MALPQPETGLVISYSYLWRHESESGQVEGNKNRPCVIVLLVQHKETGAKTVTVAPITHSPPQDPTAAMEIPPKVKQYLGLDAERSWVVLDDFNEFAWPGFDLRPVLGRPERYDYGILPPGFFAKLVRRIIELKGAGRKFISSRNDG